ncbi:Tyrosine phosphatase family protein [Pseudooceanicola antarcticus]|uniref:Protein tyrosine phosphatase n=1 Tax=Pseudooceanicola antarcticus TaxID=1247613 RepID=A0A285ITL3_9RHOB|nr:tyrosine-protein phosphatase [Pseudooceanicola antarcticus]PJE32028.1 protein tyrosine phosphatase [Pseudooceanicola antarcticus]SNY51314.1 Tyrosine phosphatase family protein [Pseudooceanicola antarcticus]
MTLTDRIRQWERDLRNHYNTDLSTPENRRRAHIYNLWFDHAILRTFWTNFYEIAPGVWRSNHPTHKRFEQMKEMGITHVLNLRGAGGAAHYLTEKESCDRLGLTMVDCNLHARHAVPAEEILKVIEAFRSIPRPFVMHCKSGADRAGFAAALYLLCIEGRPVEEARKMLSLKYIHIRQSKTGVLDYTLDQYAQRNARSPIGFEAWLKTEYDPEQIMAGFKALPWWRR